MVTPGDSERERLYKLMETAPKRSKPLHNFSMPSLKWGNHKFLRCMKVNSDGEIASSPDLKHSVASQVQSHGLIITHHKKKKDFDSSSSEKRRSPVSNNVISRRLPLPPPTTNGDNNKSKIQTSGGGGGGDGGGDDGIEEIRAKLMFHLRTAAHKMKFDIPEERKEEDEDEEEEEEDENEDSSSPLVEAAKPWNLRKRRAACNAPTENGKVGGGGGSRNEEPKQNSLPLRTENQTQTMKSLRLRGSVTDQSKEKERRKFSIPLSRKEIEEDFMAMLGSKPSRRPTKRPKIIQKQVDAVFPGLWLSEVTVDAYRVPDFVEPGKR